MKFVIAIPARLESKRLPNKAILDIEGKPMIQRVLERCQETSEEFSLVLCTDNEKLASVAKGININVLETSKECNSGTDRIASVINKLILIAWGEEKEKLDLDDKSLLEKTFIINVQGDQPLINPEIIDRMIREFKKKNNEYKIITPVYKLSSENIHNPSVVKTLLTYDGRAIYFSRAAIPFIRDVSQDHWHKLTNYWGHVGIYGFRADILKNWPSLPSSKLENLEKLEQLRLIDYGYTIKTFKVNEPSISVDTIEQLEEVRKLVREFN
tara:strand:+ start:223 stop:1029 length:807 start_codon:yes stop_codon:yes gene_type:complete